MRVLVTGGAGYVGAHAVKCLAKSGHHPVVFDNFERGHRDAIRWGDFLEGDLRKPEDVARAFKAHKFDAVMHFAAFAYVGESNDKPLAYYENNVTGTINLLRVMETAGVKRIVFSSSCTLYGNATRETLDESVAVSPVSPYGRSKAMCEQMLVDATAYGFRSVCLRYFNAAGADPDRELSERHDPETHLIPLAIDAAMGKIGRLKVFGDDYPTPDGTCIRDYIHVSDLALAHVAALIKMNDLPATSAINLGTGQGHSVREVLASVGRIVGKGVPHDVVGRRPGDPPRLVADPSRAKKVLGWTPKHSSLEEIVRTAAAVR